jgi:hypothetical protein
MRSSTAVLDLELSNPVPPAADLRRLSSAQVLIRLHGRPLGLVDARIERGRLLLDDLLRAFLETHAWSLGAPLVERAIAIGRAPAWPDVRPLLECRPNTRSCAPRVSVVARSAGAADAVDYPNLDRGNTGDGDIVVLVPEGVVLDRGWVDAAVRVFIADPAVMAVAGLLLPRTMGGRLTASLARRWHQTAIIPEMPGPIAIWRPALEQLESDHTVVYEPSAIAWHAWRSAGDPFAEAEVSPTDAALRRIDLAEAPHSIADALDDVALRVDVSWEGRAVGTVDIQHRGGVVSPFRIHDAVAQQLTAAALDVRLALGSTAVRAIVTAELARFILSLRGRTPRAGACPAWMVERPAA